ncbi:MAG: hypothetical protein E6G39_03250, partial [Actinobacteria bacterium]
ALDAHDSALSRSEIATRSVLAAATATTTAGIEFTGDIGRSSDDRSWSSLTLAIDAATQPYVASAAALWLARTCGNGHATVAVADRSTRDLVSALAPLARRPLMAIEPLTASVCSSRFVAHVAERTERAVASGPWLADVVARDPELRARAATESNAIGPLLVVDMDVDMDQPSIQRDPAAVVHLRVGAHGAVLDYATDAINTSTAARAGEQIEALALALGTRPDDPIGTLVVATASEQAMLDALNATERALPDDQTITAEFRAQVARTPAAPAVTANGVTFSYRELATETDRIAAKLRGAGVGRGGRVGLALLRDKWLLPSLLAVIADRRRRCRPRRNHRQRPCARP